MKIKVAIVEDNHTLREGLETLINLTDDMECIFACDTIKDAMLLASKFSPDVMLLDIQLPDGTGIDIIPKLKELRPAIQIVVITVYDDAVRIFQALKVGACGYILKREKPERLIEAAREAYNGGVPMPPEIARIVISHFQDQKKEEKTVDNLTPREKEVLDLVAIGLGNKEIACRIGVSVATVRFHLQNIYEKLHVHSRTEAALKFKKHLK